MIRVACVGDSITRGRVSVNYVELLQKHFGDDYCFINKGVDGDLAYNVLCRLDDVITYEPDYIIVMIGSNDVLATYSEKSCNYYRTSKSLPVCPTEEWFRENLEKIVEKLRLQSHAALALVSLPLITEARESAMYQRSIVYSGIIKETADKFGVGYVRLNEAQQEFYRTHESQPKTWYMQKWKFSLRIAFQHFILLKSWDDISKKYGFLLTIDHIHQNSTGAGQISDVILEYLAASENGIQ
jgi:acyl-CoA thioesterase I